MFTMSSPMVIHHCIGTIVAIPMFMISSKKPECNRKIMIGDFSGCRQHWKPRRSRLCQWSCRLFQEQTQVHQCHHLPRPLKIRNTLEMIPDDDNDEKYCPFLQYDTGAKLPLEIQIPHHLRQYGAGTEVPIKSLLGHRSQAPPEVRLVLKIHGLTAIVLKSFTFFPPFLQFSWFIRLKRLISV